MKVQARKSRIQHHQRALPARQSGAVLVIALIVLLVLTVLGVAGSRGSLIEERVAGNAQDAAIAFQMAEAALREGERFLQQAELPFFTGVDGLHIPAAAGQAPLWRTINWDEASLVRSYTPLNTPPGSLANAGASYIIEELPRTLGPGESLAADIPMDEPRHYRITARGQGAGNATITLQATYRR